MESSTSRAAPRLGRLQLRDPWLPLAIAALALVVAATQLRAMVSVTYANSDSASAPVIAALLGDAPADRAVTVGNYPWYEVLWFMRATHGLPHYRAVWEAAPLAFAALGLALVVWMAVRAFDRWTGALVAAALGAAVAGGMWRFLLAPLWHGSSLVHVCVLGAALVLFLSWRARTAWLVLGGLVVAGVTAVGVASDLSVVLQGVLPFAGAALLTWWLARDARTARVAVAAGAVAVVALVAGRLLVAAMESDGIRAADFHVHFLGGTRLWSNIGLLLQSFAGLGGGDFYGRPVGLSSSLALLAALLVYVAGAVLVRALVRWARGTPRATAQPPVAIAYTAFWGLSALVSVAAFLLSSLPEDANSARYLLGAGVAVAALLPVALRSGEVRRKALVAGLCAFAAVVVAIRIVSPVEHREPPLSNAVKHFALDHGAKYGYAPYWHAASLTWAARLEVQAFPVTQCGGLRVCPYYLHTISTWYRPRPRTRTFLVVDRSVPNGTIGPDRAYGRPLATGVVEDAKVYVYDHDIAAQFPR